MTASTLRPRSRGRDRHIAMAIGTHVALLLVIVVFAAPFLLSVATSLDAARRTTWPWPNEPTLEHYRLLFEERHVGTALKNSLIVSGSTTLLAVPIAGLAGYGLSRLKFRRKVWIAYGILLLTAIPISATMVPIYDLAKRLELFDSYKGLVASHLAIVLPLLVWLMKGYHDAIPLAQEEAAWTDGASVFRAWRDVVFPQTLAGLAVVAGFAFANAWAEVVMVVILIGDNAKATLPFHFFYEATESGGQVTAALGVLYVVPVLLVFLALRRVMIRGVVDATPV